MTPSSDERSFDQRDTEKVRGLSSAPPARPRRATPIDLHDRFLQMLAAKVERDLENEPVTRDTREDAPDDTTPV
ncbi:MAG: hypothetical protein AB7S26_18410 [Sandaracinaceae bacterium]